MATTGTTNSRIKVAGYTKATQFGSGISYTAFDPDILSPQIQSGPEKASLFTMGNFAITTNMAPKTDKVFVTNKFSNFVSLNDLSLTLEQAQALLTNNAGVLLNLDSTNLSNYSLFSSLSELIRVSLEEIIINWPASLYMTPLIQKSTDINTLSGNTVVNYQYNSLTDTATFKIPTNFITNNFQLNYQQNGTIANTFNAGNSLRNIVPNFLSYSVLFNSSEYPLVGFTGSTNLLNDFLYVAVNGNPFSGYPTNAGIYYHIKPNSSNVDQFFNALPTFQAYLLNRQAIPLYTSSFKYPVKSDSGVLLYVTKSFTWPVSDGYNIDFNTINYTNYVTNLLTISQDYDLYTSNLMNRFLVTESITDFDTAPVYFSTEDMDTSGQKMNKNLNIYGVEFDEINNFISGIAFANTVSYDKQNNIPDIYLKDLAKVFGWGLISSVLENDLLRNYVSAPTSTYSGMSVGLTAVEADVELWRRLILNTPWIWKSKGTRKAIEFLFKFIGAPEGLFKFNQYVYVADAPINITVFQEALALNGLSTDLSIYPLDADGYPNPLADTSDMYFQSNGLWYRETGGSGSTIDILTGNNPHLGPYDGGYKYINQFRTLIPNFSAVTISSTTIVTGTTNLFNNYNLGIVNGYSGNTYVTPTNNDGSDLSGCIVVSSTIIPSPKPKTIANECSCIGDSSNDSSLSICIEGSTTTNVIDSENCSSEIQSVTIASDGTLLFNKYQYNVDGSVYAPYGSPVLNISQFTSQACCTASNGVIGISNFNKYSINANAEPFKLNFTIQVDLIDGTSPTWTDLVSLFLSGINPNGSITTIQSSFTIRNRDINDVFIQPTVDSVTQNIIGANIPDGSTFECTGVDNTNNTISFILSFNSPFYYGSQFAPFKSADTYDTEHYPTPRVTVVSQTWSIENVSTSLQNTGNICCSGPCSSAVLNYDWVPFDTQPTPSNWNDTIPDYQNNFVLAFKDKNGVNRTVSKDGSNCIGNYYTTVEPNYTDPVTNEVGFACRLTRTGWFDIDKEINGNGNGTFPSASVIWNTYYLRSIGAIPFDGLFTVV